MIQHCFLLVPILFLNYVAVESAQEGGREKKREEQKKIVIQPPYKDIIE